MLSPKHSKLHGVVAYNSESLILRLGSCLMLNDVVDVVVVVDLITQFLGSRFITTNHRVATRFWHSNQCNAKCNRPSGRDWAAAEIKWD